MPTFAETTDIETRLARSLTDAEGDLVEQLLESIGDEILEATGHDEDWADALDADEKIYKAFKGVSIEAVRRLLTNPSSAESLSEQLGSYSHTERFREEALSAGLYLTDQERRRVRKVVYGRNVVSTRMESVISEAYDEQIDPNDPVDFE